MPELHIHLSPGGPEVLHLYVHGDNDNFVVHQENGSGSGESAWNAFRKFS